MSSKTPLYDHEKLMTDDLFVHAIDPMARLFYLLLAMMATGNGGYLKAGPVFLTFEQAARSVGFTGDVQKAAEALLALELVAQDEHGLFLPEQKKRAELREKRSRAGARGGEVTTAQRSDVRSNVVPFRRPEKSLENPCSSVCSSKSRGGAETASGAGFDGGAAAAAKKEKRTKKEKNNKYIYILGSKIRIDDRGTPANGVQFDGDFFTVFKREWDALAAQVPGGAEALYDLLDGHDRWLAAHPHRAGADWAANDNWLAPLLGLVKRMQGGAARAGGAA